MLKKPGLEELVRELEKDYARWEQVYMAGSKDPFWPDGVNANLCRNHILCGKRRIRELYPDAEMPEIYYRPLPQELPAEYMARKEELRSAALRSYTRYISDENFCFIRNHVERIPETDALRGILDALLARADVLKDAVLSGDYVAMRRYADAGSLLASLKSGAERLRDWEPPEQEQLDLFTEEDRLEQEYADVYKDPLLGEYLAAEVAVCRIIQQVNKELIGCLDFEAILYEE